MAKIINPFIVTGKIAPEYFCDRVQEANQPGLSSRLPTAIIWLSFHRAVWVKQG